MVRSWPKNKFFTPIPNNMALKRVKLPSIYVCTRASATNHHEPFVLVLALK